MVLLLLQSGADVNRRDYVSYMGLVRVNIKDLRLKMLPCTFWSKQTPLHLAAEYGRRDVVLLLLQSGADVNIQDDMDGRGL